MKRLLLFISVLLLICTKGAAQTVLLGLTSTGGVNAGGTAVSIATTGTNFTPYQNFLRSGNAPQGDLVKGADSWFYGMTFNGGTVGGGTIFKISSIGAMTIVKNLNLSTTGGYPSGSLILAKDGNFYGMLNQGVSTVTERCSSSPLLVYFPY